METMGSHLKVRQMIEDARSKISDKELFESAAMRSHLSDIAAAAGKRYRRVAFEC